MATSYNGYPLVLSYGSPLLTKLSANGKLFAPNPGILAGDVGVVMNHLADWLDTNIEPLDLAGYDKDDWCYTQKTVTGGDGSTWSCHFSGTAFDYNAQKHGQHRVGTWEPWQKTAINAYLTDFLEGSVIWGENWSRSSIDGMHFEAGRSRVLMAKVADKIRAIGLPITPVPPQPIPEDDMTDEERKLLADAVAGINTVISILGSTVGQGQTSFETTIEATLAQQQQNTNLLKELQGAVSNTNTRILKAIENLAKS